MLIGIIGDTHGSVPAWQACLEGPFKNADKILHVGDVLYHGARNPLPPGYNPKELAELINQCPLPILAAKGNCDSEVDQMVLDIALQAPYFLSELPQGRVLVTHGHIYGEDMVDKMAGRFKIKIWLSGHTHIPRLEKRRGCIFLNPGSPALPKGKKARRSAALLSLADIKLIDLDSGEVYASLAL